jgi:hypothetical protein
MTNPVVPQTLRKLWSRLAGESPQAAIPKSAIPKSAIPKSAIPKSAIPKADVIVHNPAAKRAHDLDDPFFDDDVQARMADVIAGHAQKNK